jgi:5-methylcytosine-specific restriction endonuclease McrBC GTP-binding regulatory subunit McrB
VSAFQASGNQIDIPKKVATDFFNVPLANIEGSENIGINICHISDLKTFEIIEIQPATNPRWSTKLNKFLADKGDKLKDGDLLVFEKLGRSFCVRTITNGDKKHDALIDLFEKEEKHMLLSSCIETQPKDTENIKSTYRPYITAIKSKPFLLLAGISGTGKSRIVRELARACWEEGTEEYKAHKPKNFEMVQVKPNWHDSSELIGYVSRVSGEPEFIAGDFLKFVAKAWENIDVPHFLCLDEMNLAPVEQYFAEYLSVVESRKCTEDGTIMTDSILKPEYKIDNDTGEKIYVKWYDNLVKDLLRDCPIEKLHALTTQFKEDGISIPQNLIVVGTVNMDETTFSFSRKVLDRAMTIEMNEVDLKGGLEKRHEPIGKLGKAELMGMAVEGVDVYKSKQEVCDKVITYLQKINDKLEGTPFKVAYRTRNEFLLYVVNNLPYKQEGKSEDFVIQRALDEITSMKVLSRIEGDETKVSRTFLNSLEEVIKTYLPEILEKDSVSLKKITEMKKRLESGYTSFWS